MQEIGSILPVVLKSHLRFGEPRVIEILKPLWSRVVGKPIAQQSCPVAFAGGILLLNTACLAWAAQLHEMREEIRAQINNFWGSPVVKKVRVRYEPKLLAEAGNWKLETGNAELDRGSKPGDQPLLSHSGLPNSLGSEVAKVVEQSFAKYFSRRGARYPKSRARDS